MILSLTTTHRPATDLGHLLHKHPDRLHTSELGFGRAHVFYPEAGEERCTATLYLDLDPVGLVRRPEGGAGLADEYVNDRPYVASSFLSVALSRVFGTALGGRSKDRPELAATAIPLEAEIPVLPCRRGGETLLRQLFAPLGYEVEVTRHPLDPQLEGLGESPYYHLRLRGTQRLADLLAHLYVLVPVLDEEKHYWIGEDEVEKLMRHGEGWLSAHPERETIARRYLRHGTLVRDALARLLTLAEREAEARAEGKFPAIVDQLPPGDEDSSAGEAPAPPSEGTTSGSAAAIAAVPAESPSSEGDSPSSDDKPRKAPLRELRLEAARDALLATGARRVLDLGCGEGALLRLLLREPSFTEIVGLDVSHRVLETAGQRLGFERMNEARRKRIRLLHGSLTYRDARLAGFDAAALIEVIEHLDPPRLAAFEEVLFRWTRPGAIVLTTPNADYNVRYENLESGHLRHPDHRFEWTREELANWARTRAERYGYSVAFHPVGPEDPEVGSPTQMAVFTRA